MRNFKQGSLISEKQTEPQLRIDLPCYLYIRRSTGGQVKESEMSKVQQDELMEEKLLALGFREIIKVDLDDGSSAQKAPLDRPGMQIVLRAIETGDIGAIAAFDASRLYRDRTRVYSNQFIQAVTPKNVPIILSKKNRVKVYWPVDDDNMDDLRDAFEFAQEQLSQFYDKANPARLLAVERNLSYGGHSVPLGYIVVGQKKHKHYVIYEPHAELVRWLFKRYRQLGGNLGRLGRELVSSDFHFPDFDRGFLFRQGADVPHIALPHDDKGYRCQTRSALVGLLSNPAYIGWYVFKDTVISESAHDAIVDRELFDYAFSRLSKKNLDGSDNEDRPQVERHTAKVNALLEGLITNGVIPVYAMSDGTYTAREQVNSMWKTTALVLPIQALDALVSTIMIDTLALVQANNLLYFCDPETGETVDQLAAKVKQIENETVERMGSLEQDLADIEQGIREWEMDKRSCIRTGNEDGLDTANSNLARLYKDKERTELAIKQASNKVQAVAQTGSLMQKAVDQWHGWSFDKRRNLVTMLVDGVDIAEVSPHVLQVRICFNDILEYAVIDGYMWRQRGSREIWSDTENATLKRLYNSAGKSVLLEKLPARTFASIHVQANTLKLSRQRMPADIIVSDDLCYNDLQAMKAIGMDKESRNPVWQANQELTYERTQSAASVHHNHSIPVSQQKRK